MERWQSVAVAAACSTQADEWAPRRANVRTHLGARGRAQLAKRHLLGQPRKLCMHLPDETVGAWARLHGGDSRAQGHAENARVGRELYLRAEHREEGKRTAEHDGKTVAGAVTIDAIAVADGCWLVGVTDEVPDPHCRLEGQVGGEEAEEPLGREEFERQPPALQYLEDARTTPREQRLEHLNLSVAAPQARAEEALRDLCLNELHERPEGRLLGHEQQAAK